MESNTHISHTLFNHAIQKGMKIQKEIALNLEKFTKAKTTSEFLMQIIDVENPEFSLAVGLMQIEDDYDVEDYDRWVFFTYKFQPEQFSISVEVKNNGKSDIWNFNTEISDYEGTTNGFFKFLDDSFKILQSEVDEIIAIIDEWQNGRVVPKLRTNVVGVM